MNKNADIRYKQKMISSESPAADPDPSEKNPVSGHPLKLNGTEWLSPRFDN